MSTVRIVMVVTVVSAALGACVPPKPRPIHSHRGPSTPIAIGATAIAAQDGKTGVEMQFQCAHHLLQIVCTGSKCDRQVETQPAECAPNQQVTLISPWGTPASAALPATGKVFFPVDWRSSDIDPSAADARARVAQGWRVTAERLNTEWTPPADQIPLMLRALDPAGLDLSTQPEPRAVTLEVVELDAKALVAGGRSTIEVTVRNRGPGVAYRVVAQTRSSIESLHGIRIGLGRIEPGAVASNHAIVPLPRDLTEGDAMVVVTLSEANHSQDATLSRRFKISAPRAEQAVVMFRCHFDGLAGEDKPQLDLRKPVKVQCILRNEGGPRAMGTVTARLGPKGTPLATSVVLTPGKTELAHFSFTVNAPLGSPIDVVATLSGPNVIAASTTVHGVVGRAAVCPSGKLTRSEYKKKRDELQKALQAGALTQQEFDSYDAELILCIE